ncbi:MAG: hypothetical protein HRU25_15565 [Psychrobium sp.]|nr:hypothetical protein [Psychrobium sp.]
MKLVNRISLIVTPRPALHQWLLQIDAQDLPSLEELQSEASCYLIEEPTQEQPLHELLTSLVTQHHQQIWQNELSFWDEFLDHAPALDNVKMFKTWFDISLSGLTFDLAQQPLMVASVDE